MRKPTFLNRLGRGAVADRPSAPGLVSQARGPWSWLRTLAPPTAAGPAGMAASALEATRTASALLARIQAEALEEVGPYGFQDGLCDEDEYCFTCEHLREHRRGRNAYREQVFADYNPIPRPMAMREMESRPAEAYCMIPSAEPSSVALRAPQEGVDFSATNIQEAGVDEPDIVKTDGRRILAVGDGRLWYVDVAGEKPELLSSLALPNGRAREMFISGDRALLLISRRSNHYRGMAVLIDISDPERMDISETLPGERRICFGPVGGGAGYGGVHLPFAPSARIRVSRFRFYKIAATGGGVQPAGG